MRSTCLIWLFLAGAAAAAPPPSPWISEVCPVVFATDAAQDKESGEEEEPDCD